MRGGAVLARRIGGDPRLRAHLARGPLEARHVTPREHHREAGIDQLRCGQTADASAAADDKRGADHYVAVGTAPSCDG